MTFERLLKETLLRFHAVARLQARIEAGIFPEPAQVEDFRFTAAQQTGAFFGRAGFVFRTASEFISV